MKKLHLFAVILLGVCSSLQSAPTNYWVNAGTGSWTNAGNWDRGVAPITGDESRIANGGTATIDSSQNATTMILSLGPTNGGSGNLQMTGGTLTTTSDIRIGGNSSSAGGTGLFEQSGGSVIMNSGNINIGYGTNAVGTYNLSGGSVQMNATAPIFAVANRGAGGFATVNQSGGTIYLRNNGLAQLGRNTTSVAASGTYNLSGGTLAAARLYFGNTVGTNGLSTNIFNLSTDGVLMTGTISNINTSAANTFNFTGGTLTVMICAMPVTNQGGTFSPAFIDFTNAAGTNLATLPVTAVATNVFTANSGYVQTSGTLAIDIAGPGNNDFIDIGGSTNTADATIDGTISVRMIGGYSPPVGTTFDILAADSVSSAATVVCNLGGALSSSIVTGTDGRQVLRLTVTQQPVGTAQLTSLSKPNGNSFQFSFANSPGRTFTVWASTNLTAWSNLGNATETAPGQYQFTDNQAGSVNSRFYQVRWP